GDRRRRASIGVLVVRGEGGDVAAQLTVDRIHAGDDVAVAHVAGNIDIADFRGDEEARPRNFLGRRGSRRQRARRQVVGDRRIDGRIVAGQDVRGREAGQVEGQRGSRDGVELTDGQEGTGAEGAVHQGVDGGDEDAGIGVANDAAGNLHAGDAVPGSDRG